MLSFVDLHGLPASDSRAHGSMHGLGALGKSRRPWRIEQPLDEAYPCVNLARPISLIRMFQLSFDCYEVIMFT